jgi:uncharacterized membrane protein YGL010W
MLGNRPMSEWIAQYALSHQNPANRLLHTIGIPMIAISIVLALAGIVVPALLPLAAVLFVVGWVLQFIGHAFDPSTGSGLPRAESRGEGKPPEFFKDWRFLFVGLRWWFAKISGRA